MAEFYAIKNVQVEVEQKEGKDLQAQYNVQTVDKQFQKTKQKKLLTKLNLVEHTLAKELRAQGAYIASPTVLKHYCISCAVHFQNYQS